MAEIDTAPKPFVFVLMPFSEEFTDIYEVGIKQACKDAGTYCERVDEQFYDGTILERIYNQIAKADIIVADMTGRNPNVFYETGYAHALNKQVILLTQKSEDIPFDLKSYPHIVYEGKLTRLREGLTKRIEWMTQNPSGKLFRVELSLEFYIDGIKIDQTDVKKFNLKNTGKNLTALSTTLQLYELTIDIHNPSTRVYNKGDSSIGIITSSNFPRSTNTASTSLMPDGRHIHVIDPIATIFPGLWQSISLQFGAARGFVSDIFIIRLFTEIGSEDFVIEVHPER